MNLKVTNAFGLLFGIALLMTSCVSKKDFEALQNDKSALETALATAKNDIQSCQDEKTALMGNITELENTVKAKDSDINAKQSQISLLENELEFQKKNNMNLYMKQNILHKYDLVN